MFGSLALTLSALGHISSLTGFTGRYKWPVTNTYITSVTKQQGHNFTDKHDNKDNWQILPKELYVFNGK